MIGLLTFYLPNYKPVADITWPGKLEYCQRHGYQAFAQIGDYEPGIDMGFQRVRLVYDYLRLHPEIEWLAVQGIDTIITNHTITLESIIAAYPGKEYLVAKDCHGINDDSFLIHNGEWAYRWSRFILSQYHLYKDHCWSSQKTVQDNELHPEFKDGIGIVPQNLLNSYRYLLYPPWNENTPGDFRRGDYLFHAVGLNLQERVALLSSPYVQDAIIR